MSTIARPGNIFRKDADEELVYGMDWTDWLATGASIANSVWTIADAATDDPESPILLTQDNDDIDPGGKIATVRLKVGTLGKKYKVSNLITTDESPTQKGERSFFVKMKDL